MTPLIGITTHVEDHGNEGARLMLAGQVARAVRDAGGVPVLLPTRAELAAAPEAVLARIDALLLSGGGNLAASTFEGGARPSLRATNPERYDYEVALVHAARAAGMAILGICRGMQTLAEACGGELEVNLEQIEAHRGRHYQREAPERTTHGARFASGSLLGDALGHDAPINSFHRQAVTLVPRGFRATAWSDDGLVEAIEADDGTAVGTQYHPEWLYEGAPAHAAVFRWLVERGATRGR